MAIIRLHVAPKDVQPGDVIPGLTPALSATVVSVEVRPSCAVFIRTKSPNGSAGLEVYVSQSERIFVDREMSEADVLVRDVDEALAERFGEGPSERGVRV